MRTTKLTCNVCRIVEELEPQDYMPDPPKVGWAHVTISELRPPAPQEREPFEQDAMAAAAAMAEEMPDGAPKAFFKAVRDGAARSFAEQQQFAPPPMPVTRGADLCPACAPKILGAILPHVTSERARPPIIGAF